MTKEQSKEELIRKVKMYNFQEDYCPQVVNWNNKWGVYATDREGKQFTEREKKMIRAGLSRLAKDIEKAAKSFS